MEPILGPGPPLPPPFSFLLLLGLLVIGIWSLLPGHQRGELLPAKISKTLRQQKVPESQKITKVPPPHWEDSLQMECTGSDLACFSGFPVGWAQNYTLWSMDRSLQNIFQHLDIARSSLMNLSTSSQVTSTPSSSSSTTGPRELQTLTCYECHSPEFSRVQSSSLHTNLSATQSLAYIFRESLEHRSHSLPNPSNNYSGQARVLSLPPFLLSPDKKETTEKNISLDDGAYNSTYEQGLFETKAEEDKNDSWVPKDIRNSLDLHIRKKLAQRLAPPPIFRTIKLSISPYSLAHSPMRDKKTTKKKGGNRVLKVSNSPSPNLRGRPRLPCWAPIKLSRSARWVLEGHMAWKVCTLRAQRIPAAVKQSWAILNCVIKVQNEDHKSGNSKIQAPMHFLNDTEQDINKKPPDISYPLLPTDAENDQTRPTTPKADSQPQPTPQPDTQDASCSEVVVIPGEATFLQEDVKKRLELCIKKKVNSLLKKAIKQQKDTVKKDEELSIRLKFQAVDTMKLLQTVESVSLGPGPQVKDFKGLIPESSNQVTDFWELNSGPQVQEFQIQDTNHVELTPVVQKQNVDSLKIKDLSSKLQDMDSVTTSVPEKYDADSIELTLGSPVQDVDSKGSIPEPQIKNVDSGGLIPGSQVKLTDSKKLVKGSQVKLTDSEGLILWSQVKVTDSKGLIPWSQVKLTDSKGLILESQVKLTDSKGLISESQIRLTDSKGLISGSQARLTDSKGLIPGSQARLTDSKGLILGSQARLTDSKGLIPGSQARLTDSKGLIPGPQARLTDSKGLIPGPQARLSDSKGLISGSQARLTDSKGLISGPQARLSDSKGLISGSQARLTDSKGLISESQARLTDYKGLIPGPQARLTDSKGLISGSQARLTDSKGLISGSQARLTDSKGLISGSQARLTDSKGLISGSQARLTDSKGLISGSQARLTDSKGLISGSQARLTDSKGLISGSQARLTDSKGLISGSQARLTDSKGLIPGSQARLTDSKGLIPGSQARLTDSKGLIPGPQARLTDSKGLISGSQARLTDSKGLISGSQARLTDSKGLISGSQARLTDSKGLISGSQARLTDSKGLISGSQARLTDSKGLISGSQARLTDSKGLISGSQARLTDSKGLISGSQARLTDSKGVIPWSQVKLSDSKGLIPGSQARLTDSKGLISGSQARLTDSKGLISGSQARLTDSKGLISGSQARLTDSKGLISGSQARLTDSRGLILGRQVKLTDSNGLISGSQVQLTDSNGLISGSQVQLTDSNGLISGSQVQLTDSNGLISGSQVKLIDYKGLISGSQARLTDSKGLISWSQVKLTDSKGLIVESQVKLTDSKGLISGSQVKLTDSKGLILGSLIPGSQVKLTDSNGLIPGSQVKLIDSEGLIQGSQVKLTDSKGVIPGSQVKFVDSKGLILGSLIPGSQVKLTDSKGLMLESQVKLRDSEELIQGSQVKLTDSKGVIPGSQVKFVDSKGLILGSLIPGSQVKLTDSKGLMLESQVKLRDSEELIQGSQIKLTDSKGVIPSSQVKFVDSKGLILGSLIPGSQVKLTDSKGLMLESQVKLRDSEELIQGSQVKLTDSKGLMLESQVILTDSEGLIQGSQVKLTDSKGLIPGSPVKFTDSKGLIPGSLIPGSQVKLTNSKGLMLESQVKLTDSEGLIQGSQVKLKDSKGLITGSQVKFIDSKGLIPGSLIPGSQVKLTNSKGLMLGSQVKLTDSEGLIQESQVKFTDSKGLIPGSLISGTQVKLSNSKGLMLGSQIILTDSEGLIQGSQVKLTDSKGLITGSQVKFTDSKGLIPGSLIPGSQAKLTNSKGLMLESQVKLTDSEGLIQVSQVKLTDSKGLIPESQFKHSDSRELISGSKVKLTNSKVLILKPNAQVIDSVELTPWPRIQSVDSVELTSKSKIPVTDPMQVSLKLQSPVGDSFHSIQGSIPLYISESGRITVNLKQGLHASKAREILRTMLRDLNGSTLLQKSLTFRISSKFPNTAQPSTLPRQPSHSLRQWRLSSQSLFQAPILSSRRSDHSFYQGGLRTPTAPKWAVSRKQVKAWEQRVSKGRVTRRKSSTSTSMLRKNLRAKMQQAHHVQADQNQRQSQVPSPHGPNQHFSPSKQARVSKGWQEKIPGTAPGTSIPKDILRETLCQFCRKNLPFNAHTLCQLCRKNLPFNEQLENFKSTSQDSPNLTIKGAWDSSKPVERREDMEQVSSDLRVLPQRTSPHLPPSHKMPSTENAASVQQKEKPGVSSQVRTSESQSKPLSVTSPHEQTQLLQDLQLKITQQLLKNQLSPHFTPSLTKGMFLQYPICLQCGRCSGPSCPHKFHDTSGPWLLIYPQLRLFRNSEGRGEFRVQLGFKLRNRTQIPKQQREVGPLVPMGHVPSQPDPLEKRKSKVCTCHITKKDLMLSPYPKTNLGHQPFQTLESCPTSGPIQIHIKRNLPGRRVEVTKAKCEGPDRYDFIKIHSLLNTDSKGGWAKGEVKRMLNLEQTKSPKEIRTATHKIQRVSRQSILKDRDRRWGRRTAEAPKEAPSSRHSEESTGFMQWLCLSIKRALGIACPPKASLQQMQAPWESPSSQQGSVSSEQSHGPQASKNVGKQWVRSLKTVCLATKTERKKPEKDGKTRQRFTLLSRVPKNIKINQSRVYFKSTYKSSTSRSSTPPVPESSKISHSKSGHQNTAPGQEKGLGGALNSNKARSSQVHQVIPGGTKSKHKIQQQDAGGDITGKVSWKDAHSLKGRVSSSP